MLETRIQEFSTVVPLPSSNLTEKFFLHLSGEDTAAAVGRAGVGIARSYRTQMALLDCAACFSSSVKVNQNRSQKRTLFVISLYAPTNSSEDAAKEEFYNELNRLLNMRQSSNIGLVAGDVNAQLGELSTSELGLGGRFTLGSKRTDNKDRLLHLCSTHGLFLSNTNFRHKKIH